MQHESTHVASDQPSPITDRDDGDRGLAGRVVPLLALAVMSAFVLESCLTPVPVSTSPSRFDATVAERQAIGAALAALAQLKPDAGADQVAAAINLGVINFDSGASTPTPAAAPLLDVAARAIAALPSGARLLITGHTDSRGAQEANLALSRERAAAVRNALVSRGVPAERLLTDGAGDAKPLASNATDEGRFRNRRIEFSVAP